MTWRHCLVFGVLLVTWLGTGVGAHDPNATITWNREVSRIVYQRCVSCHRPEGTAFSMLSYRDVQPHAVAIKDSVLARRMPPWGGVKGFGDFRNDQGLTQEEVSLITDWVETGMLKGNNPSALPMPPKFEKAPPIELPTGGIEVRGDLKLPNAVTLDGLVPDKVADGASLQIVATLPNGAVEPLVWLYEYKNKYRHPFLFRKPIDLPAGTVIRGVPPTAAIRLIPKTNGPK